MAQVISDPYGKGRGGQAGENIGNQIAGGLQAIAQHKMTQIQQRNQAQAYQQLGLPPDLAHGLSILPQDQQKQVLQSIGQEQGFSGAQQAGGGQAGQEMPEPWQILQKKPVGKQQQKLYSDARAQQNIINKELHPALDASRKAASAAEKDAPTFDNLRKLIASGQMSSAGWVRFRKGLDEGAKWFGGAVGGAIGGIAGLTAGGPVGALKGAGAGSTVGSGIGALVPKFAGTKADQAYKKGVYGFFRNAKDYFGNNIPVAEAQIFLDTLPTLEMDDEAKIAVLDQMEAASQLAKAEHRAQQDIIRQHGGHAPANLLELAHERIKPQYERVAADIRATMDRLLELPQETNHQEMRKTKGSYLAG